MKKIHRVALCISGQPRSIKEAYPYIKRNIIDCNENVDIFAHCWFNTENAGKQYKETSNTMGNKKVPLENSNTPALIQQLYSPIKMITEPQQDFTEQSKLFPEIPRDATNTFGSLSMWTSIKKANDLKLSFEYENSFTYDYVIRARFDCIPLKKIKVSSLNKESIHCQGVTDNANITIYDQIIIGSSKNINGVSSIVDNIFEYINKTNFWNNEYILKYYLESNNIAIKTHSWFVVLIRQETALSAILSSLKNYAKSEILKLASKSIKSIPYLGNKYILWRIKHK
ncbi:MAG: hypothetical protein QG570_262 [Patescibacteria group bacterium]|nr:hypothetical protein [Patescibacteria group bacterium]MDQ5981513.1 hypothetical protein [Patescibacteria group bacterium]